MANAIPAAARILVRNRDKGRCVRCLGGGVQWHHRRTRSVRDQHQHCTCNGIMLCNTCHPWVHSHPVLARGSGWIVSRYESEPGAIPFLRANDLWVMPRCDGSELLAAAGSLGEAITEFGEMTEVETEVYNFTQEQP